MCCMSCTRPPVVRKENLPGKTSLRSSSTREKKGVNNPCVRCLTGNFCFAGHIAGNKINVCISTCLNNTVSMMNHFSPHRSENPTSGKNFIVASHPEFPHAYSGSRLKSRFIPNGLAFTIKRKEVEEFERTEFL